MGHPRIPANEGEWAVSTPIPTHHQEWNSLQISIHYR